MTVEQETNETGVTKIQSSRYPWLIALGALVLYVFTLNHWVSLSSIPMVSKVTGWDWHTTYLQWRPTNSAPLFYLVTLPFRWLPSSLQPIALNCLSAICAALTLMLLARSVRILPQDRTRDQRMRELEDGGLLSSRESLLPALAAVLVCGLQLTFWENAVNATGEMIDLVVFAFLIRCLLEFRLSRNESWITRFVLAYGIGVTNNFALIGFFPFFLVSLIWIKGITFFNAKYLLRLSAIGLSGLLLYLLIPAVGAIFEGNNFMSLLHTELSQQKIMLFAVPRWIPLILSVPTIVALLFIGIRWPSFQGDMSAIGSLVSNIGFQIMHVLFFGVSVWIFFDIKYSPRAFGQQMLPFLTFYYMAALSVGYFVGYFYVLCAKKPAVMQGRETSGFVALLSKGVVVLLFLIAGGSAGFLAYTNLPRIKNNNQPVLNQFAAVTAKCLPEKGAIILSDDISRLMLLGAHYQAQGNKGNVLVETSSLQYKEYLDYLYNRYPQLHSILPTPDKLPPAIDSLSAIIFLNKCQQAGMPVYYIHPSFGFFFERFYMKPVGLSYQLLAYPDNVIEPPQLTAEEINANQAFWNEMDKSVLRNLPDLSKRNTEFSRDGALVGWYCSRALNYWGVELEKANRIKEAKERFAQASKLNPMNHMALVNQKFNAELLEGSAQPLDTTEIVHEAMVQNRTWEGILKSDGPTDEPGLEISFGQALAAGGNLRQALLLFERRLALLPNDFEAQLAIAKTYADMRMPDKALAAARQCEAQATTLPRQAEVLRVQALSYLMQTNLPAAEKLLLSAREQNPKDERRVNLLVEFYCTSGLTMRRMNQPDKANDQFKSALRSIDDLLGLLKDQNRSGSLEEGEALLRRAQLLVELNNYGPAIDTLNALLLRQPDNTVARMIRALAQLKSDKLPAAKRDYQQLMHDLPQQLPAIYWGLGEIAFKEKDNKAAIKHYQTFLKLAPKDSPEYKQVAERLATLRKGA